MFKHLTKALAVATIAIVASGAPATVFAKGGTIIAKPGTKIENLCVREKIKVCSGTGNSRICIWIDGPNCAIV